MNSNVRNFLYDHPEHYEAVFPEPNEETPQMCLRMFARFLESPPSSILDIGCGTGRDLAALSRDCPDCWGVDYLETMIRYARGRHPKLHFQVGDMRTLRLQRSFDVILCMGSALMYALTNEEVDQVLHTFVLHAHPRHAPHSRPQQCRQLPGRRHLQGAYGIQCRWSGFLRYSRCPASF